MMGRKKDSKEFDCLDCMHCHTRVFRETTTLRSWCGQKSIKPNPAWIEEIVDRGRLRLVWCTKQTN